ncbi:hypothetical protein MRX96_033583 [Rhipicephalus microplus]
MNTTAVPYALSSSARAYTRASSILVGTWGQVLPEARATTQSEYTPFPDTRSVRAFAMFRGHGKLYWMDEIFEKLARSGERAIGGAKEGSFIIKFSHEPVEVPRAAERQDAVGVVRALVAREHSKPGSRRHETALRRL